VDMQWSGVPDPLHNSSTAYKQNEQANQKLSFHTVSVL
jgi:hypothetical protein